MKIKSVSAKACRVALGTPSLHTERNCPGTVPHLHPVSDAERADVDGLRVLGLRGALSRNRSPWVNLDLRLLPNPSPAPSGRCAFRWSLIGCRLALGGARVVCCSRAASLAVPRRHLHLHLHHCARSPAQIRTLIGKIFKTMPRNQSSNESSASRMSSLGTSTSSRIPCL